MERKRVRKYIRKCGVCGERDDQKNMKRDKGSASGWLCNDCYAEKHTDYYIEEI